MKSSNSTRIMRIFGICTLASAFLCAALRLIAILFFFDRDIGYYNSGIMSAVATYVPSIVVIVAGVFAFIPAVGAAPEGARATRATRLCSLFPIAALSVWLIKYCIALYDYVSIYGNIPFSYVFTLLSTVGAVAFFCLAAFQKQHGNALYVVCGLFTVAWFTLSLADSYFDAHVQMNSPTKTVFQFALLSAILLTVNEMRLGLSVKRPRFHLFSTAAATVLLAVSALPSIIGYAAGKLPSSYSSLYSDIVLLSLLVLSSARLAGLCFSGNTADVEAVTPRDGDTACAASDVASSDDTNDDDRTDGTSEA